MWEAVAAKFAGSLGQGLGSAIGGGGGGPFMGGNAQTAAYGTTLDGAGWNVNTGGGFQLASASPSRSTVDPVSAANPAPLQAGMGPVALLLIGGVALALILRRGRK